jgi:heme oxygenase
MIKKQDLKQIECLRNEIERLRKSNDSKTQIFIKELKEKLDNLETEIQKIEFSDIREIIRYKYKCNYSWVKIMHLMKFNSESTARLRLTRYLENT